MKTPPPPLLSWPVWLVAVVTGCFHGPAEVIDRVFVPLCCHADERRRGDESVLLFSVPQLTIMGWLEPFAPSDTLLKSTFLLL